MDIFRFINSRDIREHLEKIGYQFNTLEAAFLVAHSRNATLQERFDAWEEIIATMPDCAPQRPQKTAPDSSFLALLREHIELQKKKLELFYSTDGAIYQFRLIEKPTRPYQDADWRYTSDIFPDVANCIRDCLEEWEATEENISGTRETVLEGEINKRWVRRPDDDGREKRIWMRINKKGEFLSLGDDYGIFWDEHQTEINRLLEDMWFDFPTPFQRGDILIDVYDPGNPFVLDSIATWGSQKMRENGFPPVVSDGADTFREKMKNGQWSDMNYYALYYGTYSSGLFNETGFNYMELERYRGPLEGGHRTLQAVSRFLKEWIDEGSMCIELLCNAFSLIQQEEQYKAFRGGIAGTYYTDEALRNYGIPRKEGEEM